MGGNYSKNLYKQLEEVLLKVDYLMEENKALKNKITIMEEKHAKEIATLNSKITSLETENQKLKDIINKNSNNSSKPPSSDSFKKIHNTREKTGKSVGGQKGHKGNVIRLHDNPTRIIEHKKEFCECGSHVKYPKEAYKAKQMVDVQIKANITEHRVFEGVCIDCKTKITNEFPKEITDIITYGDNLKSFSAMLSSEGAVSINRIKQIISELTDGIINLSDGTIAKWNKDLAERLSPVITNIKEHLLVSPVLHKDETSIRINGSINWFHVLGDKTHTLYFSHGKRGNDADKDVDILTSYSGVLVHDHLKGLYSFHCEHAECNAHILRYLKSAVENKKRTWAKEMISLLVSANDQIKELKANSISGFSPLEAQKYFDRYDEIITNGQQEFLNCAKKDYNGEDMKLLRRLKEYKTEHVRFISDFKVPFDNNQAERDLRMIKTKTKVSGCFRGKLGGEIFANIKSYTATLRKNSKNIFEGIKLAFRSKPFFC